MRQVEEECTEYKNTRVPLVVADGKHESSEEKRGEQEKAEVDLI